MAKNLTRDDSLNDPTVAPKRRRANQPHDLEKLKLTLGRHSRVSNAAAELGLSGPVVTDAFRRRGLVASSFLARVAVPEGMRIRQVTTLQGADGEVRQQSVKVDLESDDPPKFEPVPHGHAIKGMSTLLGPQGEVRGQWVKTDHEKETRVKAFWAACEAATLRYRGIASRTTAPRKTRPKTLTQYLLGDPHIGMLAWHKEAGTDFDTRIAERELFATVAELADRAPSSEDAILANLGDYVHAQSDKNLTPNGGNKLDVDGRIAKVNEIAFTLMRRMVDLLLGKHKRVRVVTVPGNHDPDTARMMAMWLRAVYENEPRVTILPNWNPITYLQFGKCLFGWAHGDGVKPERLPIVMAVDVPELWGATEFHYIHTGHEHHERVKEHPGAIVETHRTVAASDGWHGWKGYRSGKSLYAVTYHATEGEISRVKCDLSVARTRIAASKKKSA